jgi:hypothetical protein
MCLAYSSLIAYSSSPPIGLSRSIGHILEISLASNAASSVSAASFPKEAWHRKSETALRVLSSCECFSSASDGSGELWSQRA